MRTFLCLVLLTHLLIASATDNYCGIPAYPAAIPSISPVKEDVERFNHLFTFVRHGDRSTTVKQCPGFPQRVYSECPAPTHAFPGALDKSTISRYDFLVKPMPAQQILDGNCHLGQLTQRGHLMAYNNGLRIGDYLNRTLSRMKGLPITFASRSTDVHRTRETAEAFLTGVLDAMGKQRDAIAEMSPIYFVDADVDELHLGTNMCNTDEYIKEAYASEQWQSYKRDTWDPLTKYVAAKLNLTSVDLNDIFDCAKINTCMGTPNPPGLDAALEARIESAVTDYWVFGFRHNHTRSSKLFTGPLLMELQTQLALTAVDPDLYEPKFSLYSGHDFGPMMNLAASLGILDIHPVWPPYHAMINIEVVYLADQVRSYTRFLWQGEVVRPYFCGGAYYKDLCPTYVVMKYISNLLPTAQDCPRIPQRSFTELRAALERAETKLAKGLYKGADLAAVKAAVAPLLQYKPVEVEQAPLSDVERWQRAFMQ